MHDMFLRGVSRQISVEVPNMKRKENPYSEGGADTNGQKKQTGKKTGMTKQKSLCAIFENAPKNLRI